MSSKSYRLPQENENTWREKGAEPQKKRGALPPCRIAGMAIEKEFSFPASARLKDKKAFITLNRFGTKRAGNYLILHLLRQESGSNSVCLGITVSKRFGKAIRRNRFKRIVRENFRLIRSELPCGLQINVSPRSAAQRATFLEIQKELQQLLDEKEER